MNDVMVLIPALNPPPGLVDYVDSLINHGFRNILVINDGSRAEFDFIFHELTKRKACMIESHAVNLGKGRAIKNGINHLLVNPRYQECCGMVTADSDGQHSVEDVKNVGLAMKENAGTLVLGTRDFNSEQVPPKSRYGNKITRQVFRLLYGKRISDTQTGLRGISREIAHLYIALAGERFSYETNVLIETVRNQAEVTEVPIQTIYFNRNAETHFRPFHDSLTIYALLFRSFFRYTVSSLSSSAIDLGMFYLCVTTGRGIETNLRIVMATIIARGISSWFNYNMNRSFVFSQKGDRNQSAARYYLLVMLQMMCSAYLVVAGYSLLHLPETVVKIFVDMFLFLISFQIQRSYVFQK